MSELDSYKELFAATQYVIRHGSTRSDKRAAALHLYNNGTELAFTIFATTFKEDLGDMERDAIALRDIRLLKLLCDCGCIHSWMFEDAFDTALSEGWTQGANFLRSRY